MAWPVLLMGGWVWLEIGLEGGDIQRLVGSVSGAAAASYSIGFDAQGYDEMAYARLAAKRFGTEHHEYYVTPEDIVTSLPQLAALHGQPFGNGRMEIAEILKTYHVPLVEGDAKVVSN